jgi:hypothetical protein
LSLITNTKHRAFTRYLGGGRVGRGEDGEMGDHRSGHEHHPSVARYNEGVVGVSKVQRRR